MSNLRLRTVIGWSAFAWAGLLSAADLSPLDRFAAQVEAAYPGTPTLNVAAFLARPDHAAFIVVDVRQSDEQRVSQLPGAITLDEFRRAPAQSAVPVLVYCTIGMRSAGLTQTLRGEGFNAFNLQGGVLAWAAAAQPFVDSAGQPTHRVHVYGRRWNVLPPGYQPIW